MFKFFTNIKVIIGALLLFMLLACLTVFYDKPNTSSGPTSQKSLQEREKIYEKFLNIPAEGEKNGGELPEPNQNDLLASFKDVVIKDDSKRKEALEKLRKQRYNSSKIAYVKSGSEKNRVVIKDLQLPNKTIPEIGMSIGTTTMKVDMSRVLVPGTPINAILREDVQSEHEGDVTALISNDIYSRKGSHVVIPAGSLALGSYRNLKKGDKRLFLSFHQIVTSDNRIIKLNQNSNVTDQIGSTGVAGEVDNKTKEKYGNAFLFASVNALGQMEVPVYNDKNRVLVNAITKETAPIVTEEAREGRNVLPTIYIPHGSRINIQLKDWLLFPEASGEVKIITPLGFETKDEESIS